MLDSGGGEVGQILHGEGCLSPTNLEGGKGNEEYGTERLAKKRGSIKGGRKSRKRWEQRFRPAD